MVMNTHQPERAKAAPKSGVTHLSIREFDPDNGEPARTIRIPVRVFSLAATLVPGRIRQELAKEGFDVDSLLTAAKEIHSPETLVEVENHHTGKRIVVALE